jgi:hypothetical protein
MMIAALARLYPFGVLRMMVFWATPMVLAIGLGVINVFRACCRIMGRPSGYGIIAGVILSLIPVIYMHNVPRHFSYWPYHDFPKLLKVLAEHRKPTDKVLVSLNANACVHYYAHSRYNNFEYIPIEAGTLPQQGFSNASLVRKIVSERPSRFWLLTTSCDEGKLPDYIQKHGYRLHLVKQAGGNPEYGIPQLFAATKGEFKL